MSQSFELRLRSEHGAIFILGSFVLALLFFFAAIAVDGVRLFHTRFLLQKLADTAALSVVGYTVQAGAPFVTSRYGVTNLDQIPSNEIRTLAQEVVDANAEQFGLPPGYFTATAQNVDLGSGDERIFQVRITVSRTMRYLLIDKVPFFRFKPGGGGLGSQRALSATAESARRRANVSLILDISESMECPAYQPCTCLTAQRTGQPCPRPRKIDVLRNALVAFLETFDLERDRVHFVPFQLIAVPFRLVDILTQARNAGFYSGPIPLLSDIPIAELERLMDGFVAANPPTGNSNFTDGLRQAQSLMRADGVDVRSSVAYVFVTDGAPTATTLDYSNPRNATNTPNEPQRYLAQSGAINGEPEFVYVNWTNDLFNSGGR